MFVAAQLIIIRQVLGDTLMFRRSVLIFAIVVGVCGVARISSSVELLHLVTVRQMFQLTAFELVEASLEALSAVCSLAAAIAMIPLTLNSMGCRIYMDKL